MKDLAKVGLEGAENQLKPFLLHLCCAPCSPHPIEQLKKEFDLTLYFYNPNIHPEAEYLLRLGEVRKLAKETGIPLIEGEYNPDEWFLATDGLQNEPERGVRCDICIESRLKSSAEKAGQLGIQLFGTVLTVSRHKDSLMINNLGIKAAEKRRLMGAIAGIEFHKVDWKKEGGELKSATAAKKMGIARQDYCGCEPSKAARDKRVASKKMSSSNI